jgi:hypothetical protein
VDGVAFLNLFSPRHCPITSNAAPFTGNVALLRALQHTNRDTARQIIS